MKPRWSSSCIACPSFTPARRSDCHTRGVRAAIAGLPLTPEEIIGPHARQAAGTPFCGRGASSGPPYQASRRATNSFKPSAGGGQVEPKGAGRPDLDNQALGLLCPIGNRLGVLMERRDAGLVEALAFSLPAVKP